MTIHYEAQCERCDCAGTHIDGYYALVRDDDSLVRDTYSHSMTAKERHDNTVHREERAGRVVWVSPRLCLACGGRTDHAKLTLYREGRGSTWIGLLIAPVAGLVTANIHNPRFVAQLLLVVGAIPLVLWLPSDMTNLVDDAQQRRLPKARQCDHCGSKEMLALDRTVTGRTIPCPRCRAHAYRFGRVLYSM